MSREPAISAKDWPQNLWEDINQSLPRWAWKEDEMDKPSILFTPNLDSILDAALNKREQRLIRMRYEQGMSYRSIGEAFGVGSERVRQIKVVAVNKLREAKYYLRLCAVPKIESIRLLSKTKELIRQKEELEEKIEYLSGLVSEEKMAAQIETPLDASISELNIPIRALNCLAIHGINTIGELLGYTKSELREFRNLGAKSVMDIEQALNARGYELKQESPAETEPKVAE